MFRLVSALVFLSACQLQSIDGNPALNIERTSGDNYCYRSDVCAYVLTYQSSDNRSCTELERLVTAVDEVAGNVGLLGHRIDITEDQIEAIDQEQGSHTLIIHQLNVSLTADEEAMRELERRVESLPNVAEELELRLIRQQASLEERDAALIECQEDLTEVNRRVASQEQQIIDCQSQLDNERQQSTSLARQVNVKSAIIDNLTSEVQSQRRQIANQRSELTTKNRNIASLQGQVRTLQKQNQCYLDEYGADYRGRVSRTRSGKTCQRWSSQWPHEHGYYRKSMNDGIGDHNYCRNPGRGESSPWCYTTDPDITWDYCDVERRNDPDLCGRECYTGYYGEDYKGTVSRTTSGKTCQTWSRQYPHRHSYGYVGYHNYCRNPGGGEQSPWCYTTDRNTEWDYCDVGVPGRCAEDINW